MQKLNFLISALSISFLLFAGCEPESGAVSHTGNVGQMVDRTMYPGYEPVEAGILPLTDFVEDDQTSKINIFVSIEDSFGSAVKVPAVFRFELYNRLLRSAEPKGSRITIWPDINLTDAKKNNGYWRDFLRVYEFDLDFQPADDRHYILQVTCFCAGGRRLTAEYILR